MKKTISRVLASIMGGLVVTLALCFAIRRSRPQTTSLLVEAPYLE